MCFCLVVGHSHIIRFVEMTKTMFPMSKEMKRSGSYALIPKVPEKSKTHKPGGESESESEDEGGQKFD